MICCCAESPADDVKHGTIVSMTNPHEEKDGPSWTQIANTLERVSSPREEEILIAAEAPKPAERDLNVLVLAEQTPQAVEAPGPAEQTTKEALETPTPSAPAEVEPKSLVSVVPPNFEQKTDSQEVYVVEMNNMVRSLESPLTVKLFVEKPAATQVQPASNSDAPPAAASANGLEMQLANGDTDYDIDFEFGSWHPNDMTASIHTEFSQAEEDMPALRLQETLGTAIIIKDVASSQEQHKELSGQFDENVEAQQSQVMSESISSMQSLQVASAYVFPNGLPPSKSFFCVVVGSLVTVTLNYVVIPNEDPYIDSTRKSVWNCAVGCSLIWVPISILYLSQIANQFILRPYNVPLAMKDLLILGSVGAITNAGSIVFFNMIGPSYPMPFQAAYSSVFAIGGVSGSLLYMFYKRLKPIIPRKERKAYTLKSLLIIFTYNLNIVSLIIVVFVVGIIDTVPKKQQVLKFILIACIPAVRLVMKEGTEKIMRLAEKDAIYVADNMIMVVFAISTSVVVGNSDNVFVPFLLAFVDYALGILACFKMSDNKWHRIFLKMKRCSKEPTEEAVQLSIHVAKATFIASEVGEILVPCAFVCCFLVIWAGPQASGFAGVKADRHALTPPKNIWRFTLMVILMISTEIVATIGLKLAVRKLAGVDTIKEMRNFYARYGMLVTLQSIWTIHTGFCGLMLSCGFDFELVISTLSSV